MFFLCWVIHWYKDDMLSVLNGSLSKSLKCWYDRPGCSVNTSVCWICLNSSSTSFSGELCVCFPDPRMLFRPWLTLPVRDLAPLSAWQIHWTALSVKFGPTFGTTLDKAVRMLHLQVMRDIAAFPTLIINAAIPIKPLTFCRRKKRLDEEWLIKAL